ncbi:MAG: hypothetical protein J1G01_00470 [Clostridiales bacterium]|nr:hypothetical protein [Clostridiales bacterium]
MSIIDTVSAALKAERDVFPIGRSVCGNDILCAHRGGYAGKQLIVTAAIHARECYTAHVVLRQIAEFAGGGNDGVYFVPLVNPDGALFFESGDTQGSAVLERFKDRHRTWKANADGVDLNCNFDANWGTGEQNKRTVGASDYIGEYPLCAPESLALCRFTERVKPSMTVSYHCMGGELYWEFFQSGVRRVRDEKLADLIAKRIDVKKVDGDLHSAGGYKDFCVQTLGIPAVTIELIKAGEHPFGYEDFLPDILKNAHLPKFILDIL